MDALLVVRHAFAGSNRDGIASCTPPGEGLTPRGVEQALSLREGLAADQLSLGVATRLLRTQETLALVLGERDVPRIVVRELDEVDFGSFGNGPLDSYREWAASHPPSAPAPGGGESRATAAARYARGLRIVLARPEEAALLVGHALVLRYVLDAAHGLVPAALIAPVEHATPHLLARAEIERAARVLEEWSRAPRFRDPSNEG